jgi:hypothetical protein
MSDHTAEDVTLLRSLAALLEQSPRVRGLASGADPASVGEVASEAADSLVDIRRSAQVLCSELLPKLQSQQPDSADFDDTLDDIADELRHIHYHIVNTKLFNYVVPSS